MRRCRQIQLMLRGRPSHLTGISHNFEDIILENYFFSLFISQFQDKTLRLVDAQCEKDTSGFFQPGR